MNKLNGVFAVVIALMLGTLALHGQLFVYEGFEYDPGHLLLKDGGFGFGTNVWIKPPFGGVDPDVTCDVQDYGLAFTNGSGGMYLQVNGRCAAFSGVPSTPTQTRYQRATEVAFSNAVTFWTSYLIRLLTSDTDGESCFAWGCDVNQNVGQFGRTIASGKRYDGHYLMNKPYAFTSATQTNGPLVPGPTYFVVGKTTLWDTDESIPGLNAYDITWWRYENGVDTVPTNEPAIGDGVRLVGTSSNHRTVMRVGFYMAPINGVFVPFAIDEIRGGYTYESVTPFVPEGGVVGIGVVLSMLGLRKRV
ncbi:MAG: hypothetical protein N2595_05425 [bacterium]|nr:hypothetical protein [bacterium]